MSFALEEARFWRQVKRTAIASPPFMSKKDDSKDRMKRIYAQKEKICKFEDNACKTIMRFYVKLIHGSALWLP